MLRFHMRMHQMFGRERRGRCIATTLILALPPCPHSPCTTAAAEHFGEAAGTEHTGNASAATEALEEQEGVAAEEQEGDAAETLPDEECSEPTAEEPVAIAIPAPTVCLHVRVRAWMTAAPPTRVRTAMYVCMSHINV